jgi:hypothetical protein
LFAKNVKEIIENATKEIQGLKEDCSTSECKTQTIEVKANLDEDWQSFNQEELSFSEKICKEREDKDNKVSSLLTIEQA